MNDGLRCAPQPKPAQPKQAQPKPAQPKPAQPKSGQAAQAVTIDELRRASVSGLVTFHARVMLALGGRVRLWDATGSIDLVCELPEPPVGAWVRCEAFYADGTLRDARFEVLVAPTREFPQVRGDWAWFHADQSRRLGILKSRAALLAAARRFFEAQDFLEVETPLAVPSPGLDVHLDALEVSPTRAPRWLITSPEYQMKRLLSAGAPRLIQVCKCFRAGEVGAKHQPEFTMLEWYRAFAGAEELMQDTEQLVASVAQEVLGTTLLAPRNDAESPLELTPPWERLTVDDAFERYAGVRVQDVLPDEERFFLLLGTVIEPAIGKTKPTFLTHWPASMASLARLLPDAPHQADRFEAFARGLELCNGFGELTDAVEQRERLVRDQALRARLGKPVYPLDEKFLGALEEGMPPAGGNALGFDRLAMLLLGVDTIDDVVAFSAERL